ncbi:unnamed protein product [Callosobruchus maculatus]|uniref:Uncharacterized protein n=1 Tax=Callosobruchus maculatus TaxID=64391 RepID=A0A653BGV0_CALMS|nr:unnamed protein product [Callosobruchus maculatus]
MHTLFHILLTLAIFDYFIFLTALVTLVRLYLFCVVLIVYCCSYFL